MNCDLDGSSDFIRISVENGDPSLLGDFISVQLYQTKCGISKYRKREWWLVDESDSFLLPFHRN